MNIYIYLYIYIYIKCGTQNGAIDCSPPLRYRWCRLIYVSHCHLDINIYIYVYIMLYFGLTQKTLTFVIALYLYNNCNELLRSVGYYFVKWFVIVWWWWWCETM